MNRRTDTELIERALERAAVEPERVGALKRLVRQRMTAAPPVEKQAPAAAAETWDDYLWDNMPV